MLRLEIHVWSLPLWLDFPEVSRNFLKAAIVFLASAFVNHSVMKSLSSQSRPATSKVSIPAIILLRFFARMVSDLKHAVKLLKTAISCRCA